MIVDSGSNDQESNDGTNYGKMGTAIARIKNEGIKVTNPDVNTADFGFIPDENNNEIMFGMKGINAINTELAQLLIQNRPYTSFQDFCTRMIDTKLIKHAQMVNLIKAGCFLNLHSSNRNETMKEYLYHYKFAKKEKLTMSQLRNLKEFNILPDRLDLPLRVLNFQEYILHPDGFYKNIINPDKKVPQCGYHDRWFILDDNSQKFFSDHFSETPIAGVDKNGHYIVSEKKFIKEADKLIQPLREWLQSEEAVNAYNTAMFKQIWEENASGNEAHWSMQALTYYDDKHELDGINEAEYGIVNFFSLSPEPVPYDFYYRYINGENKELPRYKIDRIAGTVLEADSNHHTVSLLTQYGCVTCKLYKESYAFYNRRLSKPNNKGGKTVIEDSWFKRGTLLVVCGFRREDQFVLRNYSDTIYGHTINRILSVNPDGTLELQQERTKV